MKTKKLTKTKAVVILILLAVVLIAAVIICGPASGFLGIGEAIDVSTSEGRIEYLSSLGWCVDKSSETEAEVTLPKTFDGAVADYATMQSEQGFEFTSYGGCKCMQYSYIVTNYGDGSTVYATLFVKGGRVIGGDIHSADIGGFMHGIK